MSSSVCDRWEIEGRNCRGRCRTLITHQPKVPKEAAEAAAATLPRYFDTPSSPISSVWSGTRLHQSAMRSSLYRLGTRPLALTSPGIRCRASFSSQPARQSLTQADSQPKTELSPRWLSDFQAQLKQASAANLPKESKSELDRLGKDVSERWLDLLAGAEGYLTEPEWRGLNNHLVGWGDMVCLLPVVTSRVSS